LFPHKLDVQYESVPNNINTVEEIEQFIIDLCEQGEEWNTLKLVVLGHGEVGKTTLLHTIRRYLEDTSWLVRVCFFIYFFIFHFFSSFFVFSFLYH